MKAIRVYNYGGPEELRLDEVPTPTPGPDEVLVEQYYTSVNPIDWKMRNGSLKLFYALKFPETLGFDVAGVVAAVGAKVTGFKVGDEVFARSGIKEGRSYARFVEVEERFLALKPKSVSFAEAAAVPLAALTALQAMRDLGKLNTKPGGSVLVNGASGGVGHFAVQVARNLGAGRVVGVCGPDNVEFVRSLGADEVIDYRSTPPLERDEEFDIIFDCVAAFSYGQAKKRLKSNGVYVTTLPRPEIFLAKFLSQFTGKKAEFIVVMADGDDMRTLGEMIEAGRLKAHIDSEFALEQIAGAHERSEGGRVRGKIVVKIK